MRPAATLAAFALALAVAFGGGAAIGSVAGPIDTGGSDAADAPADDHGGH